jgi:O-antigen/teichoic acid export membrane protein
MFLLSAVSTPLIVSIYGLKWKDAGFMLAILSMVGLMKGLSHLMRSSILVKGYANMVFYATLIEAVISLPLMYYLMEAHGVYGLIYGYVAGTFLGFIFIIVVYGNLFQDLFFAPRNLVKPLIIGISIFVCIKLFLPETPSFVISFSLGILIAILIFVVLVMLFYRPYVTKLYDTAIKRLKRNGT